MEKNGLEHWRNTNALILRIHGRAVVEREIAIRGVAFSRFTSFFEELAHHAPQLQPVDHGLQRPFHRAALVPCF
jgi:hypothetical protein